MVSVVKDVGDAQSLAEIKKNADDADHNAILTHPNVAAALTVFPDAKIVEIFKTNEED